MTIEDISRLTGIAETEIEIYSRSGFIGRQENGEIRFDGDDARKIGLIRRMDRFGMSKAEIARFFDLSRSGDAANAAALLQSVRERIMCNIHEEQKALDILDCIIFETKNKSGGAL